MNGKMILEGGEKCAIPHNFVRFRTFRTPFFVQTLLKLVVFWGVIPEIHLHFS